MVTAPVIAHTAATSLRLWPRYSHDVTALTLWSRRSYRVTALTLWSRQQPCQYLTGILTGYYVKSHYTFIIGQARAPGAILLLIIIILIIILTTVCLVHTVVHTVVTALILGHHSASRSSRRSYWVILLRHGRHGAHTGRPVQARRCRWCRRSTSLSPRPVRGACTAAPARESEPTPGPRLFAGGLEGSLRASAGGRAVSDGAETRSGAARRPPNRPPSRGRPVPVGLRRNC